jgi:hypothetical protein
MAANTGQVCTFKRWRHSFKHLRLLFKHLRSLFKHVLQFMQAWQQALPGLEVPLRLGV